MKKLFAILLALAMLLTCAAALAEDAVGAPADLVEAAKVDGANSRQVYFQITLPAQAAAPLREGERLGTLRVKLAEETVAELPITAAEDVPRVGFGGVLLRLLGAMLGMKC